MSRRTMPISNQHFEKFAGVLLTVAKPRGTKRCSSRGEGVGLRLCCDRGSGEVVWVARVVSDW